MMKVTLTTNPEGRAVFLVDTGTGDKIYIPSGNACIVETPETANDIEWGSALGPDNYMYAHDLGKEIYDEYIATDWHINMNRVFDEKVNYLALEATPEEFVSIIKYAKANSNNLPEEFQDEKWKIVNADDCYCSAIIALTRPQFGESAERRLFRELAEDIEMFKTGIKVYRDSLKIIAEETNRSLEDLITVHR